MIINKKLYIILLLTGISICSFSQEWNLVWFDEFNTDGLPDNSKWSFDTEGNNWDWGNDEAQNYTPADNNNAWVEDGNLIIEARREQYYWAGDDETKNYTSARLITQGKGDWLYGKVEVRALLPTGTGMWPAIWMLSTDTEYGEWPSSGEMDIMENVGYDPNVIHCNIHTEAYNHSIGTNKGNSTTISDPHTNWHIYSLEWNAENVSFYCDGNLVFSFDNEHNTYKEWPFDKPFHLLLNIAVGGGWGGTEGIDDNIFPQRMLVDYVRVYEESDTPPVEQAAYGGNAHEIPGIIQCEDFDIGGQDVAYNDNTPTNEGAEYRTDEAVDIETSSDDDGSYNIGWTTQGEWLEYTVTVSETQTYKLTLRVSGNGDGGELSLYSDGVALASNISIPNTGDWQNWTNVVVDDIQLNAGEQIIRIEIAASDIINLNYMNFSTLSTPTTIQLRQGWNLIGYPLDETKTVESALQSIWTEVEAIKDFESFYLKSNQTGLNSLTELTWGKGYYIHVLADCELVW
ncbi:MAG: family 16 glycosylhydrolase [Bacteroidales bacterium]|jgi:beta-glucanase (GH16 family)|nr:family 16 glycosylhydrolase [Bacteroidales bacterium]